MQPNTVTLAVDILNTDVTTNQVYTRIEELVNRSTYGGPGHSFSSTNSLQLYRTNPVRSGSFLGAAKTSVKFTESVTVPSAEGEDTTYPLIVEVSFSVPVGTTSAKVLELRQRVIALLDDDAIMDPLNNQGVI